MPGTIIVTGAAGFVGFHLTQALLRRGERVVGFDNLNPYYDPALKHGRLAELAGMAEADRFTFVEGDLADREAVKALITAPDVDRVVHLGAQAGVRYSIDAPFAYLDSNLSGHLGVLEAVRATEGRIKHLVYASSSSVYGNRAEGAFSETDAVDSPISLYAATKRCDELMSQTYSHLYGIKQSGLRFFTVYGPWGRPDMAYWLFTKAIFAGEPIKVFNQGAMRRDFTYIDDIVAGVIATLDNPPPEPANRIYNIGNHNPEQLGDMIAILEREIGIEAKKIMLPMQPGDVVSTYANIGKMQSDFGWSPTTSLADGLSRFVAWYRQRFIQA
ncbi:NAD-dependent epimerase/dehydratase family protein [Caulobacter endophyticus]|uniref:Protein CapI n=1 Tax=Caulobacter endophyticus TaxID=2172652 RepID=A0A2T9KDZ1_9CAUL|nr:NAD-dependent epimerase/dehydratase family protein [Caulobacter endophyticus]PVM94192.1 protein CapI [Caulobacter endophyticus]